MLALPEQDIENAGPLCNKALAQQVESLRERVVGKVRSKRTFGVEGVVFNDGATLLLHGEMNSSTTPHLDTVLDGVISQQPSSLTIDLTQTTGISIGAFATIVRRVLKVEHLAIRLPSATSSTLINLVLNYTQGHNKGTVSSQRAPLSSQVVPFLASKGA